MWKLKFACPFSPTAFNSFFSFCCHTFHSSSFSNILMFLRCLFSVAPIYLDWYCLNVSAHPKSLFQGYSNVTTSEVRPVLNRSLTGDRMEGMNDNSRFYYIVNILPDNILGLFCYTSHSSTCHCVSLPAEGFSVQPWVFWNSLYRSDYEGELRHLPSSAF